MAFRNHVLFSEIIGFSQSHYKSEGYFLVLNRRNVSIKKNNCYSCCALLIR